MRLTLRRNYRSAECTMGELSFTTPAESYLAQTMERPWIPTPLSRGGRKGESCVPAGVYRLERHSSEAHPDTWALVNPELDVLHYEDPMRPNVRALVLIHVGNYCRESRGCILPGYGRAIDDQGIRMVTQSRRAMVDLKRLLPYDDGHTLEIL